MPIEVDNMSNLKLNLIAAACDLNMGIGYKNELPWTLKNEMAYFNRMTKTTQFPGKKNIVIMGRNTWDSIPEKFRPLKERVNVVLTRNSTIKSNIKDALVYSDWESAIKELSSSEKIEPFDKVWVIGGNSIYKAAIESPHINRIYLTRIFKDFECDVFFPEFDKNAFKLVKDPEVPSEIQEENGIKYQFEVYEKINSN